MPPPSAGQQKPLQKWPQSVLINHPLDPKMSLVGWLVGWFGKGPQMWESVRILTNLGTWLVLPCFECGNYPEQHAVSLFRLHTIRILEMCVAVDEIDIKRNENLG